MTDTSLSSLTWVPINQLSDQNIVFFFFLLFLFFFSFLSFPFHISGPYSSPCSLTWCMLVALSARHRLHRSARVVFITLKISNTVWNNTNSHFYSKIKHKSAFLSVNENIRGARLGCCNDHTNKHHCEKVCARRPQPLGMECFPGND